ncbi:MAG: inorganic phosphate transporter [Verrucomicrobiaceae bacterium]
MLTLFFCVLIAALAFEFINGFHDTANAIATVVSTKVLTPRAAIMLAATTNLFGAFMGTAVAKTIGQDYIDVSVITPVTVLAGLMAGIIWNLVTWWWGLPSSSSHALIGGLCGAAVASTAKGWDVLKWSTGLWPKLVKYMIISPLVGFAIGMLLMYALYAIFAKSAPSHVNRIFGRLQIISAAFMGYSHGTNDAQKTMGIIALAMFTATKSGALNGLPDWLGFLKLNGGEAGKFSIPEWVVVICALTMFAGTAVGGWRIIRTMGHKMVKLMPVHGFAAETSAGLVINVASWHGIPLSTTHVISASIMGVGATRRLSAVKWGVVNRIVWAWIFTLPVTGLLGFWLLKLMRLAGIS